MSLATTDAHGRPHRSILVFGGNRPSHALEPGIKNPSSEVDLLAVCSMYMQPQLPSQFQSDTDVERYVEEQFGKGLPSAWSYRRARRGLEWCIEPRVRTDKVAGWVDYILSVSGDRRFFIFYYDNTDAGCSREQALSKAMVINSDQLRGYPLAEAVSFVIRNCALNRWGLT